MNTKIASMLALASLVFTAACGGGDTDRQAPATPQDPSGLTATELEHGIGPVEPFTLTDIDEALAVAGEEVFTVKCSACHKMAERYVGPALADVTTRRSPAYVMNMILNPEEMIQRHPEAKALLAQFMTPMANQNLTEEEARAVLEFLRTQAPPQAQ